LRAAGEDVRYPKLPDPDAPRATAWAQALHAELDALPARGGATVVCHSLGCLLWAREAARVAAEGPVARVALVAPPCPWTPIVGVHEFHPTELDPGAVAASADEARVVCAEVDPVYCPRGAAHSFAEPLGLPVDLLPGAGHVNPESGFGPWPDMEAWCLQPPGAKNGVET
jgi:predicted alpha/beta hydrolase family esterase